MEFAIGTFEGPLDLLLALVKKEEMDIMDIDIHKITSQYLDVIQTSNTLNLNEGGEFIRMAAQLMLMKSKSLLPQELIEEEPEEEQALSKQDLIFALSQHSQFVQAAKQLNQRALLNRDIWSAEGLFFEEDKKEEEIESGSLFSLTEAFQKILQKAKTYSMKIQIPSVAQWLLQIRKFFIQGKTVYFSQLIRKDLKQPRLHQILLSFLSLLELGKQGFISLSQKGRDIEIHTKKNIHPSLPLKKAV